MDAREERRQTIILRVVLGLSLAVNGLNVLSYGLMALPDVRSAMQANVDMVPEMMKDTYETYLSISTTYYVCCAFLFALATAGAALMWRKRRMGFHYYTIAKLLLIAAPLLFLGRRYMNIGDIMMSGLFILYYYVALRALGVMSGKGGEKKAVEAGAGEEGAEEAEKEEEEGEKSGENE